MVSDDTMVSDNIIRTAITDYFMVLKPPNLQTFLAAHPKLSGINLTLPQSKSSFGVLSPILFQEDHIAFQISMTYVKYLRGVYVFEIVVNMNKETVKNHET